MDIFLMMQVVLVVSNKEGAGGLTIAASYGIPTKVVPHTADRVTGDTELAQVFWSSLILR